MKKITKVRVVFLLIVICFLCQGCAKQENKSTNKNENLKLSVNEEKKLIKDAEKRLKTGMNETLKEVKYDPEYYKKINYKTRDQFIKEIVSEKFQKKYSTDQIVILQAYYKDAGEVDSMIYGKDSKTGTWKYLQRFR